MHVHLGLELWHLNYYSGMSTCMHVCKCPNLENLHLLSLHKYNNKHIKVYIEQTNMGKLVNGVITNTLVSLNSIVPLLSIKVSKFYLSLSASALLLITSLLVTPTVYQPLQGWRKRYGQYGFSRTTFRDKIKWGWRLIGVGYSSNYT